MKKYLCITFILCVFLNNACSSHKTAENTPPVYDEVGAPEDPNTPRVDNLFNPNILTQDINPDALQNATIQTSRLANIIVPLNIKEDAGVARDDEPTAQGIPLAPGMRDPSLITVKDEQGNALPTQVHPLGMHHPDGSLKWILLQFDAKAAASSSKTYQLVYGLRPPLPEKPLQIDERQNEVEVNTGPMKFILPKQVSNPREDKKFLPSQVWVNDSGNFNDNDLVLNQAPQFNLVGDWEHMTVDQYRASHRNATDLDSFGLGNRSGIWASQILPNMNYSNIFSCPCKIDIEERGPIRAVFRISPERAPQEGDMSYVARIYAYAGKKYFKVELNLENYDSYFPVSTYNDGSDRQYAAILNSKHIRDFVISFNPNLDLNTSITTYGLENNSYVTGIGKLEQLGLKNSYLNGRALGSRSEGWLQAKDPEKSFMLSMPYFAEIYPKAIENDNGQINLHLWPSSTNKATPIGSGRQRNYDFLVSFDSSTDANAQSAMMRKPLRAFPPVEYVSNSGISHPSVSWEDLRFKKFKTFRQNSQNRFVTKQLLYGDLHFGDEPSWNQAPLAAADVRPDFGQSGQTTWNGYHGVSHDFFMDYFATGDSKNYRLAEVIARHFLHIDTHHNGNDAGAREMIGGRNYDHMTNWVMGGMYQWTWGDVDYYFLSGKRAVYESLVRNAQYLSGFSAYGLGGFVPERATSVPFMHMAYLYQAIGSEKAIRQLYPNYAYADDANRQDNISLENSLNILNTMKNASKFFLKSLNTWPYVQNRSHILISWFLPYTQDGCFGYWEITGDTNASECVISAADYLQEHLSLKSGMPLYSLDTNQLAGSPSRAWSPYADEVESLGTNAWLVSKNPKYLQYSWGPLDWRLNYGQMSSKMQGMNARIGTALWTLMKAGQTEEDISRLRDDIDYASALNNMKMKAEENINVYVPAQNGQAPQDNGFTNSCSLALESARILINSNRKAEALNWISRWERAGDGCISTNNDSLSIGSFKLKAQL